MLENKYIAGQSDVRPWGNWAVLATDQLFTLKKIVVSPGERLSLQYHHHRSEHWIVVSGAGVVTIGADQINVERGSHVYVPRETKHRISNNKSAPLIFVELQFGEQLDEEDIVRIEDDYKR